MAADTPDPKKITAEQVKKEIKALELLTGALADLPIEAQARIVRYAVQLYGIYIGQDVS